MGPAIGANNCHCCSITRIDSSFGCKLQESSTPVTSTTRRNHSPQKLLHSSNDSPSVSKGHMKPITLLSSSPSASLFTLLLLQLLSSFNDCSSFAQVTLANFNPPTNHHYNFQNNLDHQFYQEDFKQHQQTDKHSATTATTNLDTNHHLGNSKNNSINLPLPSELVINQQVDSSSYNNDNHRLTPTTWHQSAGSHYKKLTLLSNNLPRTRKNFLNGQLAAPSVRQMDSSSSFNNDNTNNQQQQQQQPLVLSHLQQHQRRAGLLDKICIGTSNKMLPQHNKSDHYQNLVERYKNCTYVIGNLELTWLDKSSGGGDQLDLSFLESIREITGYLLIGNVNIDRIRMPNLQIIRGRDMFKYDDQEFALFLIDNELKQLQLPNLGEILSGSVGSYNNRNLCHIRINWEEILNPTYKSVFVYQSKVPECPPCDPQCHQGYCWGEGIEMCQKFSKVQCSENCGRDGRCFGAAPNQCCHPFCAGGCTGSNQTDCIACKNYYDDGSCVQECPSLGRYNPSKFSWEFNPNGKYAFGATCVKQCPEHMLRDSGACVRVCPPNKRSFEGDCVPCGGPCPKNCQGVEVVHSGNIDQLINCTVIEGSITILDESFWGYTESQSGVPGAGGGTTNTLIGATNSNGPMHGGAQLASNGASNHALASGAGIGSSTTGAANNNGNNSALIRHKPMHPSRLEVFKTVHEITGYLKIEAKHPDFKDLSYFRNLKLIDGRQTTDMFHALSITRSSLVSLNLRSLRKIKSGKITIEENPELCFADTIDWHQLDTNGIEKVTIRNNAEQSDCLKDSLHCHEQCARDGCWGPGPNDCLSCNNYKLDDYCVVNCSATESLLGFLSHEDKNTTGRICKKCHSECKLGCDGTEATQCFQCKSVKDGPYCVPECPSHKYSNNGTCEECDKSCADGCTGPSNRLGEGGCNSCAKAIIKSLGGTGDPPEINCIRAEEPCPDGYYQEYVVSSAAQSSSTSISTSSTSSSTNAAEPASHNLLKASVAVGRPVCRRCHHRCKRCIGMGTHKTVCECAKYVAGEQCEDFCPRDYYANEETRQCIKCSPECNGCFGPTEADCISCRVYRIYYDSNSPAASATTTPAGSNSQSSMMTDVNSLHATSRGQQLKFNCTAQCPPDKPHRISESNMLDPYCSEDPGIDIEGPLMMSMGSSTILCLLVISTALMFCISIYRCQIEKDKTIKLTMHLSGIDDVEPLNPSNVKPNLAPLRSIKETELGRGKILGSGYGGTVYQGFWNPEGQENRSRPVAIKVLRDNGQSNIHKEFLEEAYIMASVNHPNLVRLLAVCMTANHLMLVTRLMPLGCLLDYVKKQKGEIGAKNLLEWGKQIASGMAYLEERRMVHRDLALRNVLLQTSNRARISDFGLAKFLEVDQSEYHSGGGKLPIRWLAPECIRERKFTHKSDVWAFGVTIWELVTFGQNPFEEYQTRDVPVAIEKGARLQQPNYLTAEVYKVMMACWFYDPKDRPNFKTLVKEFAKFARDPERYLICGNVKGIELLGINDGAKDTSDSDNCDDYSSGINSDDEETQSPTSSSQPPLSAMPDLTPSTHNRLNEMFGFELHHTRSSESEDNTPNGNLTTPILKKLGIFNHHHHHHQQHHNDHSQDIDGGVFVKSSSSRKHQLAPIKTGSNMMSITDANNNDLIANSNNNGCWTMHHTISTNSLGQRSELPTDMYDYLLPSPHTDVNGHAFSNFCSQGSYDDRTLPISASSMRNPPHSAGVVADVTNQEYFQTQANYVSQNHEESHHHRLSTSNGNIPQSLV